MNIRTLRITLAAQALLIVWLALPQAAMAAFTDNGDGTVTDSVTGLMWDRCSQGQSGAACATGAVSAMTWSAALTAAVTANTGNYKGYNDWRLPNKNELESLADLSVATNPAINLTAFPATQVSSIYWSSTTYTLSPAVAWIVAFGGGDAGAFGKTNSNAVRLVRSGQLIDAFDAQGDFTPNALSFTDQTNVPLSTLITSAPVQITGINASTSWTASGGTACVSSANNCACDVAVYAASGSILNNQYMCAQHTSSASFSTATNTLVTVGGVSDTFTSTTLAADTTPNAFTFTAQTGVALSTVATSNAITVSGINSAAPISIVGGTYSINAGAYTAAPGTVNNGDTVTLRQTSSASFSTLTTATLTIGGVSGAFDVTTLVADTTPNAFTFTAQTGVALSTVATSNAITVSGINSAAPISIVGGTYSINAGAYTAAPGTVNNGDTVTLRQTSSASFSTLTTATLTIGGVSGAFDVTTLTAPPLSACYSAPSATGSGTVTACFTGGGATCSYSAPQFIGPPPGAPPIPPTTPGPGIVFPHGLFDFITTSCTAGSTLSFTITYPAALPPGTVYWKYGPRPGPLPAGWYVLPATIVGNTATFTITDGGLGDDDLTANGTIVDQGGPGSGPAGVAASSVPALSEWAMLALVMLLGWFGMRRMGTRPMGV